MKLSTSAINSALWAAYGDALGFISELADTKGLKARCGVEYLKETVTWKRPIEGKYGVTVTLPAGCYSDDTQLRLAVSRSINSSRFFDAEAFAKVELPLWQSYQLGAGRGTSTMRRKILQKRV